MTRNIVWILLLISLVSPSLFAQQNQGNLTVISSPPGTAVTLEGEYDVAGVTPVTFGQELQGVYKLKAYRGGYENYETELVLAGRTPQTVEFEMVPKTRFKAAFRSLVVPGWGQMYNGQKFRGALYTFGTAASLVALLVTDQDFRDKRDEYNDLLEAYNNTRSVDGKSRLWPQVVDAQQDAYDAETTRRVALGVTAFIWAFNVIDAAVFFPHHGYSIGGPTSITIDTGRDFDRVMLNLAVNL